MSIEKTGRNFDKWGIFKECGKKIGNMERKRKKERKRKREPESELSSLMSEKKVFKGRLRSYHPSSHLHAL